MTTGLFIFIMAAIGVVLSFERQMTDFVDRELRSVSVPQDAQPRPMHELLAAVRRAGMGEPTAFVFRPQPQAVAIASLGTCVLVYTGLSLPIRRLVARLKRKQGPVSARKPYAEQPVSWLSVRPCALARSPEERPSPSGSPVRMATSPSEPKKFLSVSAKCSPYAAGESLSSSRS